MKTLTSLLERLNLDPEVLEACARNAEALGLPLERALYEAERINENQYLETAAARHAMPCELRLAALMDKEGSGWATDAERVCKVPLPWLRKQKVVPVRDKDGKLALAICHPSGWLLAQELGMLLGERLERPVQMDIPEAPSLHVLSDIFDERMQESQVQVVCPEEEGKACVFADRIDIAAHISPSRIVLVDAA